MTRLRRFLNNLFNVRSDEWPRMAMLYVMLFLMVFGNVWGQTGVFAGFLKETGIKQLPSLLILSAILSVAATAVYTAFADRISDNKLWLGMSALVIGGLVIGMALLYQGQTQLAYFYLYLFFTVIVQETVILHWVTYRNGFYDAQSAKRLIPILSSGGRIGAIVGGFTLARLGGIVGPISPITILFVWIVTRLLVAILTWMMPRLLKEEQRAQEHQAASRARVSFVQNIKEGAGYVAGSSYLLWLAVSTLLVMLLANFLQYQTGTMFDQAYDHDSLVRLLADLTAFGNIIMLPVQMFFLSRIIGRIGLSNTALIYPGGNLAVSGMLFVSVSLNIFTAPMAMLGHLTRTVFQNSLYSPIDSLFYNAVPLRIRGRARAFVRGIILPVSALIGGAVLLLQWISIPWFLPALIVITAIGFFISVLIVRQAYGPALIAMLEQEDFSSLISRNESDLAITDPTALRLLQQKLAESQTTEFTIFIARLISQIGGNEAVPILSQVVSQTTDSRIRSAILDMLVVTGVRSEAVSALYTSFLSDPDGRVRQAAIAGLEQSLGAGNERFLEHAFELLTDPVLDVRIQVIPALVRSGDFFYLASAVRTLDEMLNSQNPDQCARGVRVLGQVGDPRFVRNLTPYLFDPQDMVRLEAAAAVETLTHHKIPKGFDAVILDNADKLLHDPVERVRQATIKTLGRIDAPQARQALVQSLIDSSPVVRETCVDTLVALGEFGISVLEPALDDPHPQMCKMSLVALCRIDPVVFRPRLEATIEENLQAIYRNHSWLQALTPCVGSVGIDLLQNTLREQSQVLLNEIFYFVSAVHEPDAVAVIRQSFQNQNIRIQADAAEALESLTSPQTAQLVAPLFDPQVTPASLLKLGQLAWAIEQPTANTLLHHLITLADDAWVRTLATFALGEIGGFISEHKPVEASEQPKAAAIEATEALPEDRADAAEALPPARPKKRRGNPLDMLASVFDEEDEARQRRQKRESRVKRVGALIESFVSEVTEKNEPQPEVEPPKPSENVNSDIKARYRRLFSQGEVKALLTAAERDTSPDVRNTAAAAQLIMAGMSLIEAIQEDNVLSTIEKIIFLKEVPFFRGMTIDQLRVLADICDEERFEEDAYIFREGDPGGVLYVVVDGRVAIEREGKRKGSSTRLATINTYSYFGEMTLFDSGSRTASAVALRDTLTLSLRRDPLVTLARQQPDLSIELIQVLSERLREANQQIAALSPSRPRELHKLFDQYE